MNGGYSFDPTGHAYRAPRPGPGAAVVDLMPARSKISVIVGVAFLVLGGGASLVAAVTDSFNPPGWGTRIVGAFFGVLFLGPGAFFLVRIKTILRDRSLLVGPAGIRYVDPQGRGWEAGWNDLKAVGLVARSKRRQLGGTSTTYRIELLPSDPQGFRRRNPQTAAFAGGWGAGPGGFGMPLAKAGGRVEELDRALRQWGGGRYRGIDDKGILLGFKGYV